MTDDGCSLTTGAEILIPDQSLIPAQELTASSSDHRGRGGDNDGFTRSMEPSGGTALQLPSGGQATAVAATGKSQNYCIPESPPPVAIQMDQDHNPPQSSGQTIATVISSSTTTSTAGSAGPAHMTNGITITGASSSLPSPNPIAVQSFKLGKTFLGLAFQAAVALLIFRFQPQGDSTPFSFLFNMVGATVVCGFTLTLIGMLLRKAHSTAANISGYAGFLSFVLGFFLMMGMYVPERYGWLVWTAAGVLFLAIAYSIAKRS